MVISPPRVRNVVAVEPSPSGSPPRSSTPGRAAHASSKAPNLPIRVSSSPAGSSSHGGSSPLPASRTKYFMPNPLPRGRRLSPAPPRRAAPPEFDNPGEKSRLIRPGALDDVEVAVDEAVVRLHLAEEHAQRAADGLGVRRDGTLQVRGRELVGGGADGGEPTPQHLA